VDTHPGESCRGETYEKRLITRLNGGLIILGSGKSLFMVSVHCIPMTGQAILLSAVPGAGFQELFDRFTASIPKDPKTHWLILPPDALVRIVLIGLLRLLMGDLWCFLPADNSGMIT
jgi:hypothetical protein